jgi:SAM-dependent methyltransferase
MRKPPYRWDLTEQELRLVEAAKQPRLSALDALRACLRYPGLVLPALASLRRGAIDGVRNDPSLVWSLNAERIRRAVPDAATGVNWRGAEEFVEVLRPRITTSDTVLEVGCGSGRVARFVGTEVGELVCCDVSRVALEEAKRNLAHLSNIRYVETRGYRLDPLLDESFDAVYAHDVFLVFDLNQALALLDEIRRVLREAGVFALSFFTIDRPEWAREQLDIVRRANMGDRFSGSQPRAYTSGQIEALCDVVGLEVTDRIYGSEDRGRPHYIVAGRAAPRA